jgi:anti-anti-sigma factor
MSTFATTSRRPAPTPTQPAGATGWLHGSGAEQQTVADASSDQTNLVTGADDTIIVPVAGEVDLDTVALLHTRLIQAINRGYRVCCDLSQVTFFGADGANTLLVAHCHATACGRRFSLRGAHGLTHHVLTTTGLDRVLTIED